MQGIHPHPLLLSLLLFDSNTNTSHLDSFPNLVATTSATTSTSLSLTSWQQHHHLFPTKYNHPSWSKDKEISIFGIGTFFLKKTIRTPPGMTSLEPGCMHVFCIKASLGCWIFRHSSLSPQVLRIYAFPDHLVPRRLHQWFIVHRRFEFNSIFPDFLRPALNIP